MRHFLFLGLLVASVLFCRPASACTMPASICESPIEGALPLIEGGEPAGILIDATADPALHHVAEDFAEDLGRVGGHVGRIAMNPENAPRRVVIIGIAGESPLIDSLVERGLIDLSRLSGQWEAFHVEVVQAPWPNVSEALVIAGSDRRGAVFGTYDLSERMGVSPWYWFADVPVRQASDLFVTAGRRSEQPGVRYRGFFINDEDPALSGWAEDTFGGVNSAMYERVFELLLRMKGNYIWPAMWAPKSFHLDDPRSAILADEMGIVMGTSHHEPLTRAQAEWHRLENDPSTGGAWNYLTNAENLRAFWSGGLERMMSKGGGQTFENLLTIGMRGDGDEPMSEGTAIELLETIVSDQRKLIEEVTGRPAEETPQVWALYKEVQDYYDRGMKVPEDVTLLFADDNWGQIRRLPTHDLHRVGGFGVYYHFDYVGAPRNYKWMNTNHVEKVWQQMNLAYERGARGIWIVNVGDIKPMEYPLDFFLRMAWAPDEMTPQALARYPEEWAARQFGEDQADVIGDLMTEFGRLASRRKPELLDASTFPIGKAAPDHLVKGEYDLIVDEWRRLSAEMERIRQHIPANQESAFFQLVEFPILAIANLYEMYAATAWNRQLALNNDPRANLFADRVEAAFARDAELTQKYHAIESGKWNHMMSQVHMSYVIWNDPTEQVMPTIVRVAGDVPEKMRNARIVFTSPEVGPGHLLRNAAEADRNIKGGELAWHEIPGLGESSAAMIALPQGRAATDPDEAPRLEYDFVVPATTDAQIRLHLLPTLDTIGRGGVRIGVSVDGGAVRELVMDLEPTGGAADTPGKRAWYDAVIQNRVVLTARTGRLLPGDHTIKVWRIDDNVILDRVELEFNAANMD